MPWTSREIAIRPGRLRNGAAKWRVSMPAASHRLPRPAPRPVHRGVRAPRSGFEDLIDGVAMDLQCNRYETFEELRQYCLRVASAVGLICVEIFGYRDLRPRLRDRSRHRAAADEYHPRRGARSRARPGVHPSRGSAAFRVHRGRLRAGVVTDNVRAAARVSSRAGAALLSESGYGAAAPRRAAAGGGAHHGRDLFRAAASIERAGYDVFRQPCASDGRARR